MASKLKNNKVLKTLTDRYGVGALVRDYIFVEWATALVERAHGAECAAKDLRAINRFRERMGCYTAIPAWGTELWAAYFPKEQR